MILKVALVLKCRLAQLFDIRTPLVVLLHISVLSGMVGLIRELIIIITLPQIFELFVLLLTGSRQSRKLLGLVCKLLSNRVIVLLPICDRSGLGKVLYNASVVDVLRPLELPFGDPVF